jgi:WD40 repeat protein
MRNENENERGTWTPNDGWDSSDEAPEAPVVSSLDGAAGGAGAARGWLGQWRWGLRLGGLVAALALLALIVPALAPLIPRPPSPPPPPDFTALTLSPDLGFCATNGYWSPDGRRIAVVRASAECGVTPGKPDVFVYDAASGKQVAAISITPTVQRALTRAGLEDVVTDYTSVAWSPDQRTLAVSLAVVRALPASAGRTGLGTRAGVALVSLTGSLAGSHAGDVVALLSARDLAPPALGTGAAAGPLTIDEWDTRLLTARQIDLPPALGYEWLPAGELIATDPLPTDAQGAMGAAGPSGDPIGGQRFSMWRTGFLSAINAVDCQERGARASSGPFTLLDLHTAAWSPDGRYLLAINATTRAPQTPPPTSRAPLPFCVTGPVASALPVAPMHDRALGSALRLLGGAITQVDLLWSPDGKRLVALPDSVSSLPGTALIYDTATGAIQARISAGPSQIPGAQGSDASALIVGCSWSPDGRRLLMVVAGQRFNIRVYQPRALG